MLATELPKEVLGIYWAKNMYWRAGKPERFVRPVRWVVAMLERQWCRSRNRRHRRRQYQPRPSHPPRRSARRDRRWQRATLKHCARAKVVVDVAERRQSIRKALDAATRTVPGARWREDEALVETVVHLTEWPTVILGEFEAEYLALPEEVLVTVMRDHQKYFAVEGADGKLAPHFLAVLNTQVDDEGAADHSPRQRPGAARAVQRCALLLGLRSEDAACRARR